MNKQTAFILIYFKSLVWKRWITNDTTKCLRVLIASTVEGLVGFLAQKREAFVVFITGSCIPQGSSFLIPYFAYRKYSQLKCGLERLKQVINLYSQETKTEGEGARDAHTELQAVALQLSRKHTETSFSFNSFLQYRVLIISSCCFHGEVSREAVQEHQHTTKQTELDYHPFLSFFKVTF